MSDSFGIAPQSRLGDPRFALLSGFGALLPAAPLRPCPPLPPFISLSLRVKRQGTTKPMDRGPGTC
jgi:hypothetical protein